MIFPIIAKLARDADQSCNYFVCFVGTVCNKKSGLTMNMTCLPFNNMKKDVERFEGERSSFAEGEASDSTDQI